MKKYKWYFILSIVAIGIIGTIILNKSEKKDPAKEKDQYVKLEKKTIENKQLISGRLQSSKEVNIKSELAGIIDELYVQVGDQVRKGQAIGKIRILPDPRSSQDATRQIEIAKINLERIKANYQRNKLLYEKDVISRMEYEVSLQEYKTAQTDLNNAEQNLRIVRQGFTNKSDFVSNVIYSTIDGVVLDIPVKVGGSIQNRNNFSEGTTIATIADMNEFLFKGQISEKDLRYVSKNQKLDINISALKGETFSGFVTKIAPKGVDVSGITRFDIEAKLDIPPTELYKVRSGFTATAEFLRESSQNVYAIEEKYVQFSADTAFVYVRKGEEDRERKILDLGISDGKYVEIKKGLKSEDKILKELEVINEQ